MIANCTTETCSTTSDQTCSACAGGYYLANNVCPSCTTIANCTSESCTTSTDQTCAACVGGYYLSNNVCTACSGACPAGQYQTAACSSSSDRVCSACAASCATCSGSASNACLTCTGGNAPVNGVCQEPSCEAYLTDNPGAVTGIYTIYPGGTATQAYCDMSSAGGGWTQVLDQDTSILPPSSTTLAEWAGPYNAGTPNNGQYSIMNLITQLKSGTNYQFLIVYVTNPGGGTIQWTQVENPTTFNSTASRPTVSGLVENPTPMYDDAASGQNQFTGLSLTVSGNSTFLETAGRSRRATGGSQLAKS